MALDVDDIIGKGAAGFGSMAATAWASVNTGFPSRALTELWASIAHATAARLDDVSTVGAMAEKWVRHVSQGNSSAMLDSKDFKAAFLAGVGWNARVNV